MDEKYAQELLDTLWSIAASQKLAVQIAEDSLELQRKSLAIMQTNSNANMAFHLEMSEALKNDE